MFFRRLRFVTLLTLALLMIATNATYSAKARPATQGGQLVADSKFRPETHGFGFQNYGNEGGVTNLTSIEVRRLYGDKVCASEIAADGTCKLTQPAKEWMDGANNAMDGGHCDGMATLASLFYYYADSQKLFPKDFGDPVVANIGLTDNKKLQREIAYWFVTQAAIPPNGELKITPAEVVTMLIEGMKDNKITYTIGIYQPDRSGGHSITPYAVRDMGDGIYQILVYDNNFPKEEKNIEVNTKTNKWKYFTAANPNEAGAEYQGDADTLTLTLTPDTVRKGQKPCPVCESNESSGRIDGVGRQLVTQYNQIWLIGDFEEGSALSLLITDETGKRLGYVNGKFVSEIPGAYAVFPRSGPKTLDDKQEPVYYLPLSVKPTVTLDATQSTREEEAEIVFLGPGHSISIENILVNPGQKDTATFSADGNSLTYKTSSGESPDIWFGLSQKGADYAFGLYGFDLDPNAEVNVTLDSKAGTLAIKTLGAKVPATYALYVNRVDEKLDQEFYHDGVELPANATGTINYGAWDGKGNLTIDLDTNGDGKPDSTITEPNTPKP